MAEKEYRPKRGDIVKQHSDDISKNGIGIVLGWIDGETLVVKLLGEDYAEKICSGREDDFLLIMTPDELTKIANSSPDDIKLYSSIE